MYWIDCSLHSFVITKEKKCGKEDAMTFHFGKRLLCLHTGMFKSRQKVNTGDNDTGKSSFETISNSNSNERQE